MGDKRATLVKKVPQCHPHSRRLPVTSDIVVCFTRRRALFANESMVVVGDNSGRILIQCPEINDERL